MLYGVQPLKNYGGGYNESVSIHLSYTTSDIPSRVMRLSVYSEVITVAGVIIEGVGSSRLHHLRKLGTNCSFNYSEKTLCC